MINLTYYPLLVFCFGVVLGAVIAWLLCRLQFKNESSDLIAKASRYEENSRLLQEEYARYRNDLPKQLQNWFELYVNKEMNKQKDQLRQSSQENVGNMLQPLQENLARFYRTLNDDRMTILNSLRNFSDFTETMRKDYHGLVSVLRGNIKFQGHWGEISLQRIFENAGLIENQDYVLQGKNIDMHNDDNNRQRPDAVIHLPSNKHLIIDAKSPLKYYEECINNQNNPEEFQVFLQKFVQALKMHITNLSRRFYQNNTNKLSSPDFVLLFLPIDGILNLLIKYKSDILDYAASMKVTLVTPSTLLLSMKTVSSLWLLERQNRNTVKIIDLSSRMCDKLVSFVTALQSVGDNLQRTHDSYEEAMHRLSIGHDSLISRAKKLQELGVNTKKPSNVFDDMQTKFSQVHDAQTTDKSE